MQPLICTPDYPCWIPGIGFRVVEVTSTACAINDTPMTGKMPPPYYGTDDFDPLELLRFIFPGEAQSVADPVHVAAVPVPGSLELMGGLMAIALLFWALPRMAEGAEKVRGKKKSGWA